MLTAAVEPTTLPEAAERAVEDAAGISRKHLPLLAALRLRALDPAWWHTLPWPDLTAGPRRGLRRSVQLDPRPIWYLGAMTAAQIDECPYPALVKLLLGRGMGSPDLPGDFTPADQVRLYLAAASLLHAGLAADGFAARGSAPCAICQRSFPMDSLTLNTLTFSQSSRYCRDCAEDAQFGSRAR